jgi:hypothetical protein
MYGPWRAQDRQFALLRTLVRDFGMTLENQDQRFFPTTNSHDISGTDHALNSFLLQCAGWIGEGRHLGLLDVILECGFDPSNINSPSFQRWPPPLSPNWISEELTPDPFFIEYLAALAKASPGEFNDISNW